MMVLVFGDDIIFNNKKVDDFFDKRHQLLRKYGVNYVTRFPSWEDARLWKGLRKRHDKKVCLRPFSPHTAIGKVKRDIKQLIALKKKNSNF